MARIRKNATVVGFAASALVAASLWSVPPLAADETPPADHVATETSELPPEPIPEPTPEPKPTMSTSPEPGASTSPSPSDSLSPTSSATPTPTKSPTPTTSASPTLDSPWTECPDNAPLGQCPPTPELTSITPLAKSISISWGWSDVEDPANHPEVTLVRVRPGNKQLRVEGKASTTIEGLAPLTQYSIELTSIDGSQLSAPSMPRLISTLEEPDIKPQARPGDVEGLIVTLRDEVDPESDAEEASKELSLTGVEVADVQDLGTTDARVKLAEGVSDADAEVLIADLQRSPKVASVEVDQRILRAAFPADPPNDTDWSTLWGLHGTYGVGIGTNSSTMTSVWSAGQGAGTVVAVLDNGYTDHPDLNDNIVSGYDFVDNRTGLCRNGVTDSDGDYVATGTYGALGWDNNPLDPGDWTDVSSDQCSVTSSSWHGTHVAGTIAAEVNNATGIAGVAPLASIQPIRVLSYDGGYTSDITAAIKWASGESVGGVPDNSTPADVINLSLGGSGSCTSTWQNAIDTAVANGSVVVVAAGNSASDASNFVPASCNNVITVAAIDSTGARASYSNYGANIDIAAPGSGIRSTSDSGAKAPAGASYANYSGTSMAAPHVSGVAALLIEDDPTLTPAQVLSEMQATALAFPTGTARDCTTSTCGPGLLRATTQPVVSGLSPSSGTTAGGDAVTITGYNLNSPSSVTFDGSSAAITASSARTAVVTTPAGTAGTVDVVVTNAYGSATYSSAYTYTAPAPSGGGGGGGGGGAFIPPPTSGGGGGAAITPTQPADSSNQVDAPGQLRIVDSAGRSVPLSRAELSATGLIVAGGEWSVRSTGPLTATSTEVEPGSSFTFNGDGLRRLSTVGIYVLSEPTWVASGIVGFDGTFQASFDMPPLEPGQHTLQVNAVLADETPVSMGVGFTLKSSLPAPAPTTVETPSANFLAFSKRSTKLRGFVRKALRQIASDTGTTPVDVRIVAYTDLKESRAANSRAEKRGDRVVSYLESAGLSAPMTVKLVPAGTKIQQRGVVVYVQPAPTTDSSSQVQSIIVRLKKDRSPLVDGEVRGASLVTVVPPGSLSLGRNLGPRMYRFDFDTPITPDIAQEVANQLAEDPGIAFAEPDSIVTAQPSVGIRSSK